MKKRMIAMLVALLMLALPVVSLADLSANTNAEGYPIVNETETFRIYAGRQVLDLSKSYNDKIASQLSEEETNIHIEWIESTDPTEQVNLMLASGDLPDAFMGSINEAQLLKNVERFIPLQDLIAEYAPNIQAGYDKYDLWPGQTMGDGNVYSLATSVYTGYDNWADGIPIINKAWLDKLGLEIPTTLDEFYDVLYAFRNEDPNGNGLKDEIPAAFCEVDWCTHLLEYAGSWGFTNYYKIENGEYIATPTLPEFREFLEFYNKCYQEGLIDPEGFSQTTQQHISKLREDKVGVVYTWTQDSVWDEEEAKNWVVLRPVAAPGFEGEARLSGRVEVFNGNRFGFAITTACENPEALVRWLDRQYESTENKLQWHLGEEGLLWRQAEDGTIYMNYPESTKTMSIENMKYTYGNMSYIPCLLFPGEIPEPDAEVSPSSAARKIMVDEVVDMIPTEGLPYRSAPAEKVVERDLIWTDLKAYLDSFVATSIIEGVTDASWQEHLDTVELYGLSEWTQWYQDFLDGKF